MFDSPIFKWLFRIIIVLGLVGIAAVSLGVGI
jgi:hypothetical protein